MLTIDALRAYGANTDEALARCFGNEAFYLRLVGMVAKDEHFAAMDKAIAAGDARAAFEAAHALKGVLANLSLTPALEPVSKITEYLRAGQIEPCLPLLGPARREISRLLALIQG